MQKKIDVIKLAGVTNWRPEAGANEATPPPSSYYAYEETELNELPDRIDFIFNPVRWQTQKTKTVYLGVYASE